VHVDIDDLIDSSETAEELGLSNPGGVSVYRRRYDDFPTPAVEKGRCVLFRRSEIKAWKRARGGPTDPPS
jgi:predicted DNA-binding transcriptional regulator AlpA